jgi:hypothetical protein
MVAEGRWRAMASSCRGGVSISSRLARLLSRRLWKVPFPCDAGRRHSAQPPSGSLLVLESVAAVRIMLLWKVVEGKLEWSLVVGSLELRNGEGRGGCINLVWNGSVRERGTQSCGNTSVNLRDSFNGIRGRTCPSRGLDARSGISPANKCNGKLLLIEVEKLN